MRKFLSLACAGALAGSLGGCAAVESLESNLASPTTTQAAANVKSFVAAFACGLSAAAGGAQGVEALKDANGNPIVDARGQAITSIVYASSTVACNLLGGKVLSTTPVSVPSTSVVS